MECSVEAVKVFWRNTTRSVAEVWRFWRKPAGLRPLQTYFLAVIFVNIFLSLFDYRLILPEGHNKKNQLLISSGVGGRGLCAGEAGFKPGTCKAALSRNEAVKNKRSDSGVVFCQCSGEARADCEWSKGAGSRKPGTIVRAADGCRLRQGWRSFCFGSECVGKSKGWTK